MLGFFPIGAAPLGYGGDPLKARGTGVASGVATVTGYAVVDFIDDGPKRSGVCFPSYGREAVWTSPSAFDADYPVAALSDLDQVRLVALRSDSGATVLDFVLPATRTIDFLALIHHNGAGSTTFTLQLSSGTDPTANIVYAGPLESVWGNALPIEGYPAVRPILLAEPIAVRSGRISLGANTSPWEIGCIEIGQFWAWDDVAVSTGIGIESSAVSLRTAGGVDHITAQWSPRVANGSRTALDHSELEGRLMDFHRARGLSQAFVWCWDADDAGTWRRQAFLARNRTLPPGKFTDPLSGELAYDFLEYLG